MKNRVLKSLLIVVFACLVIFGFNRYVIVKADSGWDTDYGHSSSRNSGSSYSSRHDSSSRSNSSYDYDRSSSGSGSSCTTEKCKRRRLIVGIISGFVCSISIIIVIIKMPRSTKIELLREFLVVVSIILSFISSIILFPSFGVTSFGLVFIVILLFIIFNLYIKRTKKNESKHQNNLNPIFHFKEISHEMADSIIPNFDIEEFKSKAYQIFYDTQMCWMDFDYDKLKNILSDELYNMYEMDLEALKIKNQKNIMKDFELIDIKLNTLYEDGKNYCARVILEVKFIDYVEDSIKHKVLRGSDKTKVDNTYILIFVRSKEEKSVNKCPKCGADVEGNVTGICSYCKTKFTNNTFDWVMSKKEKISQR